MGPSYRDTLRASAPRRAGDARAAASMALSWFMQRFPFLSHVALIILCAIGPIFAPHLLAFCLVAVHIVFVVCQSRTAYGIFACWRGTLAHSRRDWAQWWLEQKRELERAGKGDHVLALAGVQHIVILPAYKEDVATLKESLDVLASHPLASHSYYVCLGMEEREAGAPSKAQSLVDEYYKRGSFADISYSLHPGNIIGESAGKSSNVNWAARHMARRRDVASQRRTIVTVMDADTAFASDFFLASAAHFSLARPEERRRMMFVPPTLFDRNSADVPIFTRATDIFWSCAGIGGIYPSSWCKIPTSAYAVSLDLARFCDFWDAGPEAIGEDLHFYCKAMFETKGNVKAVTIYSPASQCNVVGNPGTGPISSYLQDMFARWTQATRHLWGSLDFGYCWHRILTGQIGRSRPKQGYMALETSANVDEQLRRQNQQLHQNLVLDLPGNSRTPSPSVTATTDSSDDTLTEYTIARHRKTTQFDDLQLPGAAISIDLEANDKEEAEYSKDMMDDDLDEDDDEALLLLDIDDQAGEEDKLKLLPLVVLMTRLYEAHLMIAQVFLMGLLVTIYPSAILRNGHVVFTDVYSRACTVTDCVQSIFESPFAAGAELPAGTAPGLHPTWMMPTIVFCALRAARFLGGCGILATVSMCAIHDCYHHVAATVRWQASDSIMRDYESQGPSMTRDSPLSSVTQRPPRYLGKRPHQNCKRKWPAALLDFAAIPAGLLYGIAPLLWAQLNHVITNKLTYTVSAKSKTVVVVPGARGLQAVASATPRRSFERVRASMEMTRMSSTTNLPAAIAANAATLSVVEEKRELANAATKSSRRLHA